ncbi:MAG: UDP-2,4-diacetamido-2,4,6-trideoxy-beta-L-altropyranose hydrolase [Rhodocyclaceae bacterium]|nr:UDP-2,4-diacetamido-2,4,6-trideoxy-beta-L-altropyranose hydrolase [Rhodocyclaceae bacterium]
MKVAFRADASIELGAGHIMRCLTLADELRAHGARTLFLCWRLPGHLGDLILARGHALSWLPDTGLVAEVSADALAAAAPHDWLVVDHYALAADWEQAQRGVAEKILVIDDLADRMHDCDLLLDQNLQEAGRYDARLNASCRRLIGPDYALLRPEFRVVRERGLIVRRTPRRLLVSFGGADVGGETLKALAAIVSLNRADLAVDVVIGAANPHRAAIEQACGALANARALVDVVDMAALIAEADLAIGAGGGSNWERCCLGLPAVLVAIADNQVAASQVLAEAGAAAYLGTSARVDVETWRDGITACLRGDWLAVASVRASELADGRGAERVADAMEINT